MADLLAGTRVTVRPPETPAAHLVAVVGPAGPAGAGVVHTQSTPAASVTITHSLGRLPNVDVYVAGDQVDTDLTATDTTVTVVFAAPTTFVAILN